MTDDVGPFDPDAVEDAEDVADEVEDPVALDLSRPRRLAEAAQVGGDHPEAGRRECVGLIAPQPVGVGEAMQHDDRRPVTAGVLNVEREVVSSDGDHAAIMARPAALVVRRVAGTKVQSAGPPVT